MSYQKNKFGLYDEEIVKESKLPCYDLTQDEETGISLDLFTKTDLKNLGFYLDEDEQKEMIKGFLIISKRQKGWAALYSLVEVLDKKMGYKPKMFSKGPWDGIEF